MIDLIPEGGSMDCKENRLNLDVERLQKAGGKFTRLLRKECKDAIEAMYVVKAILYLLRCELNAAGVVIGNEAQADAELISMIDRATSEGE
jgi:hypothetical protein